MHCVGGMIVRNDGHANPFRTTQAFRHKSVELGVRIIERAPVTDIHYKNMSWSVHTPKGHFSSPAIVNCAGAWGVNIASMLGEGHLPYKAAALMLSITERLPPFINPVVGAQGRALSFKQFDNGTVMIGGGAQGTADPQNNVTSLNFQQLAINVNSAATLFPIIRQARIVRSWAGMEGVVSDTLPFLGSATHPGAWHAFGFSAHGFQLGPISGRIIADLVTEGSTELPIEAFSINRFKNS